MSTIREHYRTVFHAPGADQVIDHLCAYARSLGEAERPGANALIALITRMILTPERAPRIRTVKSNGGRIAHG